MNNENQRNNRKKNNTKTQYFRSRWVHSTETWCAGPEWLAEFEDGEAEWKKTCLELRNWVVFAVVFLQFRWQHEWTRAVPAAVECTREHLCWLLDCDSLPGAVSELCLVGPSIGGSFAALDCTVLKKTLNASPPARPLKQHCERAAVAVHSGSLYIGNDSTVLEKAREIEAGVCR